MQTETEVLGSVLRSLVELRLTGTPQRDLQKALRKANQGAACALEVVAGCLDWSPNKLLEWRGNYDAAELDQRVRDDAWAAG